jgi:hypothetical protein
MKMFMSALLAIQLFLWNAALAKQPCKSTVVGDPQADAPTIQTVDIGNGITLHYYVFNNPHAWDQMTNSAREETLRDAQ